MSIRFSRWFLGALLVAAVFVPSQALAKVRVVTTVQIFRSLTEQIGGELVEAVALVGQGVDPHQVDPRPSYAVTMNKADLLVHVGLELEKGWLPPLLEQSRNPKITTGQTGNLEAASVGIPVLDVGTGATRAQGDIHPRGNPHFWLPPENVLKISTAIAGRLKAIDSKNAAAYDAGLAKLLAEIKAKQKTWATVAQGLKGTKILTYHKSWSYLSQWLGLEEVGYIEPKPGVPPDPAHLVRLVGEAKRVGAKMCIVEAYYPRNTSKRVADLAGLKLLPLPPDVGGKLNTYVALMDSLLGDLSRAAH
jgi:zinc/manganese transport system substrate-binding protein